MDSTSDALAAAIIHEARRRLCSECVPRLKTCVSMLSTEEIWYRPNAETVSIGNLVLHLCGNLRQWVLSGLGGRPDVRRRQAEFDQRGPIPANELLQRLDDVMADVELALDRLTPGQLLEVRRVQGFDETGVAILVHVTEHFSYHVGQVTYAVKSRKGVDVGYYKGIDLN
ncbi:MAG: DUF1572 domain-containing protein [Acidimicrobiia bacterium]|nr:DUF1572 domain-containing protein [Acidimicrobiia bacterium]